MYLHSCLWFLAAVFVAKKVYGLFNTTPTVVYLATVMLLINTYAIAPLIWIAGRNAFIVMFFILAAVYFYVKHDQKGVGRHYYVALVQRMGGGGA